MSLMVFRLNWLLAMRLITVEAAGPAFIVTPTGSVIALGIDSIGSFLSMNTVVVVVGLPT